MQEFANPDYFNHIPDVEMSHSVFPQDQGTNSSGLGRENSAKMKNNQEQSTKQGSWWRVISMFYYSLNI